MNILDEIKLEPIEISDAILTYNEIILKEDILDSLLLVCPENSDEYNTVSKATKNFESEDKFAKCDLSIVLIGVIPYNKERIKAIKFKNTYEEKIDKIMKMINSFFVGFELLKNNKNFHKLLEILLA